MRLRSNSGDLYEYRNCIINIKKLVKKASKIYSVTVFNLGHCFIYGISNKQAFSKFNWLFVISGSLLDGAFNRNYKHYKIWRLQKRSVPILVEQDNDRCIFYNVRIIGIGIHNNNFGNTQKIDQGLLL